MEEASIEKKILVLQTWFHVSQVFGHIRFYVEINIICLSGYFGRFREKLLHPCFGFLLAYHEGVGVKLEKYFLFHLCA